MAATGGPSLCGDTVAAATSTVAVEAVLFELVPVVIEAVVEPEDVVLNVLDCLVALVLVDRAVLIEVEPPLLR
jgi:hypothetical protein